MRDVLKDLQDYSEKYGNDLKHNSITIKDVHKVMDAYEIEAPAGIAQLFCHIGYMRGYRDGQRDVKEVNG